MNNELLAPAQAHQWVICFDGWKTESRCLLNERTIELVAEYASEILIHAILLEGSCRGVDWDLIRYLGGRSHSNCRIVYAGGVDSMQCFEKIEELSSRNSIDVTIGSALDLYGGSQVRYDDCVQWNRSRGGYR